MRVGYLLIFGFFLLFNCKNKNTSTKEMLTADTIISKAIEVSGGSKFDVSKISFNFRGTTYLAERNNGSYTLARLNVSENDSIIDFISNDGFARFVNNQFTEVSDSMATKYSASVNAVHYFSVLPYGLNQEAVNKKLLGTETVANRDYFVIQVTFDEVGGGEDFEDIFVYWIDSQTFKIGYLAYSYAEDDGIGKRFRVSRNERYVNGLRFADYDNYKPKVFTLPLERLAKAYEEGNLEMVSKIDLENITVDLIDN